MTIQQELKVSRDFLKMLMEAPEEYFKCYKYRNSDLYGFGDRFGDFDILT